MALDWELRLGDCLDQLTGLASLPDDSVGVTIADPPYTSHVHANQLATGEKESLPFDALSEEQRTAVAHQIARVTMRWVLVFAALEDVAAWKKALEGAGLNWRRTCVWIRLDAMPQLTGDRPAQGAEAIIAAHRPGRSRWHGGGRTGVYSCLTERNDRSHPTQKPLPLLEALLRDFSDPGELVCDPFAGACTTGVAARRLGRGFIGWEIDPRFYEVGRRRLSGAREQMRLFETA